LVCGIDGNRCVSPLVVLLVLFISVKSRINENYQILLVERHKIITFYLSIVPGKFAQFAQKKVRASLENVKIKLYFENLIK